MNGADENLVFLDMPSFCICSQRGGTKRLINLFHINGKMWKKSTFFHGLHNFFEVLYRITLAVATMNQRDRMPAFVLMNVTQNSIQAVHMTHKNIDALTSGDIVFMFEETRNGWEPHSETFQPCIQAFTINNAARQDHR